MPRPFEKLNRFGIPNLGLIVATVIPAILVVTVKDVAGLAYLYAVGVVGAIATNLGASSTDKKLATVGAPVDVLHLPHHGIDRGLALYRQALSKSWLIVHNDDFFLIVIQ